MRYIALLAYLWGMETYKGKERESQDFLLLAYLWGMETAFSIAPGRVASQVVSLPMRDGNY